jgi:hypothetical protein
VKAFEDAIRFQGDNRRAYLAAIQSLYLLGSAACEARDWAKAIEALGKATRLYAKAEPWPLDLAARARDETYRAAYLAGKTARFQLEDAALATEFLTLAQKLINTFEVQEMLLRLASGKPEDDSPLS